MTALALGTDYVDAFRNGRLAGDKYENGHFVTAEWDLTGTIVRRLDTWASELALDSGTRTTGTYRTATAATRWVSGRTAPSPAPSSPARTSAASTGR